VLYDITTKFYMKKLSIFISLLILFSCNTGRKNENLSKDLNIQKIDTMIHTTAEEWKDELTPEQYYVMIEKGTERPFTGEYWNTFTEGTYKCAACGYELFDSETKFDAHCGWPSFYDSIDKSHIKTAEDYKLGYKRTEIMCARCGAHLGHVFDDGPNPTGQRYCVNSISVKLDTTSEK
jgi:peptide-methionine (R)-S-oxide reductase